MTPAALHQKIILPRQRQLTDEMIKVKISRPIYIRKGAGRGFESIGTIFPSGKEIEMLLNENMDQGDHSLLLNNNNFSKGVYMVQMISDFGIENQKLIVQ